MATPSYTTDKLIASIKRRGMIPDSPNSLGSTDLLSFMNDEIDTYIVPLLMSVRGEYLTAEATISVTASTASYSLPDRAIGAKVRDVELLNGTTYEKLEYIEPNRAEWSSSYTATPTSYTFRGNKIVLYPTPSAAETLRVVYFQRPNRCVLEADCGLITAKTSTTVTISAAPSDFETAADEYDFIKGTPPAFECRAIDQSGTRSSTTLTFASGVPTGVAVNDYVAQAGETPIPQIPVELHPLLAQRVVCRVLEALGAPQKLAAAEATAERMRRSALSLLSPRVEGTSRRIVNRNAPGFGRAAKWNP